MPEAMTSACILSNVTQGPRACVLKSLVMLRVLLVPQEDLVHCKPLLLCQVAAASPRKLNVLLSRQAAPVGGQAGLTALDRALDLWKHTATHSSQRVIGCVDSCREMSADAAASTTGNGKDTSSLTQLWQLWSGPGQLAAALVDIHSNSLI